MSEAGLLGCFGNVTDAEVANSTQTGGAKQLRPFGCCYWTLGAIVIILLLFPVVSIPILFTLYAKLSKNIQIQVQPLARYSTNTEITLILFVGIFMIMYDGSLLSFACKLRLKYRTLYQPLDNSVSPGSCWHL